MFTCIECLESRSYWGILNFHKKTITFLKFPSVLGGALYNSLTIVIHIGIDWATPFCSHWNLQRFLRKFLILYSSPSKAWQNWSCIELVEKRIFWYYLPRLPLDYHTSMGKVCSNLRKFCKEKTAKILMMLKPQPTDSSFQLATFFFVLIVVMTVVALF